MYSRSVVVAAVLACIAFSGPATAGQDRFISQIHIDGAQGGHVRSIETFSGSSGLAFAAIEGGGVYKTDDGGATWTESDTGITDKRLRAVRAKPASTSVLYAGADGGAGFFRSTDGGATWQASNSGLGTHFVKNVSVASTAGTVFLATSCGVYKSVDEGVNWTRSNGIPCTTVYSVRASADGVNVRAATFSGVYLSGDSGDNFSATGLTSLTHDVRFVSAGVLIAAVPGNGMWRTINNGTNWSQVVTIPAQATPIAGITQVGTDFWVALDGVGVYKSTDGGATWALDSSLSGLPAKSVRFFTDDPNTGTTWWAATLAGVYTSPDSGANWSKASVGLPEGHVVNFAADSSDPNVFYAEADTIYKSTDGGVNWAPADNGLGGHTYQGYGVATDPSSPNIVYASTANAGMYKSIDGGANWNPINNGLPGMVGTPPWFRMAPSDPLTIYLALDNGTGVWKTANGGANWVNVSGNLGTLDSDALRTRKIVIDPTDPNRVYVATRAGVFGTTDGGTNWQWRHPGGTLGFNINRVEMLSSDPQTLLAAAYNVDGQDRALSYSGAFLTRDGGDTWEQIVSNEKITTGLFVQTPGGEARAYFLTWGHSDSSMTDSGGVYKCTDITSGDFAADDKHCAQADLAPSAGIPWSLGSNGTRIRAVATSSGGYRHRFAFLGPDFNNDSKADILWRNGATGDNANWLMDHSGFRYDPNSGGVGMLNNVGGTWQIAATADFDGDGTSDILWRDSATGDNYVFFVDRSTVLPSSGFTNSVPTDWQVAGTGDFNGDGKADILWRNSTGDDYIFFMDGTTVLGTSNYTNSVGAPWTVAGIGDFDGDGKADILWRNATTGDDYVFFIDGVTVLASSNYTNAVPTSWIVAGLGDFNQDGKADIVWRNPTGGENYVFVMDGLAVQGTSGYLPTVPDANWEIVGVSDFDGTEEAGAGPVARGISDLLWRNATDGSLYMWKMLGPTTLGGFCNQMGCTNGSLPTVPDTNWQVVAK